MKRILFWTTIAGIWAGASIALLGCTFVIGRHPDTTYASRSCYPCIEVTRKFGVGIQASEFDKLGFVFGWNYK